MNHNRWRNGFKNIRFFVIFLIFLILLIITFFICLNISSKHKMDVNKLKNSVVQIFVYDDNGDSIATGSGVIAFENDIVLTNAHVIEDNEKINVISEDNKKYNVEGILAYNKKKDVAILKLSSGKDLKALKISEKALIGGRVIAIGSPLGLKNVISDGILSGYFQENIKAYQHTAPISPGSSGGALIDEKGNLIGITYASINGGQNLNLAIPIKEFKDEYKIVKNNKSIATKYYNFLNNNIFKTKKGNDLLYYVLNDKYDNYKFKSGDYDEMKMKNGNLEKCNSLVNCIYISNEDYKKIEDNVSASFYINSGIPEIVGTVYFIDNEPFVDNSITTKEEGYQIIMFKLKDSSENSISQIKNFIRNEFNSDKLQIKNNNKYVYGFYCSNYDECDEVKKILDQFVK